MVVCGKCGNDLDAECFSRDARAQNGLCSRCKECSAEYQKQYREQNADKLLAQKKEYYAEHREELISKVQKRYCEKKDEILAYHCQHYEDTKEQHSTHAKEYYQEHKQEIKRKVARYAHKRYQRDPKFRTICRLRHRLREAFKRYSRNGKTRPSADYGIDYDAIFRYIGPCPGTMEKYHIDHIRPLCLFDFDDPAQVKLAFAPENHQWLRKEDNLAKHCKTAIVIQDEAAQGEDR